MATDQEARSLLCPAPRRPIALLNPRRGRKSSTQPSSKSAANLEPPLTTADAACRVDDENDKQVTPTRRRMAALRDEAQALHIDSTSSSSLLAPPQPLRTSPPALGNISNNFTRTLTSTLISSSGDAVRRSASPPLRRGSGTSDASSSDLLTAPNPPYAPHQQHILTPRTPKPLQAGKAVCSPIPRDWTANPLARVRCLNLGVWPGNGGGGAVELPTSHAAALLAMQDLVEAAEQSKLAA